MDALITTRHDDQPYRRRSAVLSTILWVGLIVLFLLPFFSYEDPPPGQEGILVELGMIDVGQKSAEGAAAAEVAEEPRPEAEPTPVEEPEPEVEVVEEVTPPEPTPVEEVVEETAPAPQPDPDVIRQQQEAAVALAERREAQRRADVKRAEDLRIAAAEERVRREEEAAQKAAAERRRAEEAAAKRAAEQEARAAALRASTGDLFSGSGEGAGAGDGGAAGNQGDPGGKRNAGPRTGITSGAGSVGGGLEGRGVLSSPKINDRSQLDGRVVIKVCVGPDGSVTSADYTQIGSTTSQSTLVTLARKNAMRYRFAPSDRDQQCGKITYEFVVE